MKLDPVPTRIAAALVSTVLLTGPGRAEDAPPEFLAFAMGLNLQKVAEACDFPTSGTQRAAIAAKLANLKSLIRPEAVAAMEQKMQAKAADCPESPKDKQELEVFLSALLSKSPKDIKALMDAGSGAWSVPAAAPGGAAELPKRVTVEGFANSLREKGYKAEVVRNPDKTAFIRTGMNGRRIAIYFTDCEGESCGGYQFRTYFDAQPKLDLALANSWNRDKRYSKAYLDKDNDLNLEWDVDLSSGVGPDLIPATIDSFASMAANFEKALP